MTTTVPSTKRDDYNQNECFLRTYTSSEEFRKTGSLKLPLECFIIYSLFKTLQIKTIKLCLVYKCEENPDFLELKIKNDLIYKLRELTPWPVRLTTYPCAFYEDTVITGLCAVARHITSHKSESFCTREHTNGLLGFRNSCLQAPNEVSIWTKFCEMDILGTTRDVLKNSTLKQIPQNLVRFETHLSKSVRIHNIKKIQQARRKSELNANLSAISCSEKGSNEIAMIAGSQKKAVSSFPNPTGANNKKHPICADKFTLLEENDEIPSRIPKARKWKSSLKTNPGSEHPTSNDENLHEFAEGPFFSVADLMLLPQYYIFRQRIGKKLFKTSLPLTEKWFTNIMGFQELNILRDIFSSLTLTPAEISNKKLPKCKDCSLYKRDPKRNNPKKRLFTKEADIENALQALTDGMELPIEANILDFESVNMAELPRLVNPMAGWLPKNRAERKTEQLHNLVLAVKTLAKDGDVIVDFCCGSGHLGLILAYLLPRCTIILLENKAKSLADANERGTIMPLNNIVYFQCNLDFFVGKFDIGIGLHACGIATDLILDKCLKARAKFVLTPCCYGSLHETDRFVYPRSKMFQLLPLVQYMCIGHASDQTHGDKHPLTERGERCMAIIDSDRGHLAKEHGYKVTLTKLKPSTCTPKNNLLIGEPLDEQVCTL